MAETMPVVESRRIRVLVAEDHRIAREAIQRCLEQQADMAVVGAAANGSETVHLAQRQRPDVAVLDLRLSELRDGEVQEPLRRALARTRIVLVTNAEHVRALRAEGRTGVHGYLERSMSSGELIDAVRVVHQGGTYVQRAIAQELLQASRIGGPTPRERQVLRLADDGLENEEIAKRLGISVNTVKFHLKDIFAKLNATCRAEMLHSARQERWIE